MTPNWAAISAQIAAVVAGVAGVLSNGGSGHALTHGFAVFGYHVTGSTGTLFLYGIVVGAIAVLGLSLLLAGARRTSRRGREARHGLRESRRQTAAVSQDRDDLLGQRETARSYTASTLGAGTAGDRRPGGDGGQRSSRRLFGRSAKDGPQGPLESVIPCPGWHERKSGRSRCTARYRPTGHLIHAQANLNPRGPGGMSSVRGPAGLSQCTCSFGAMRPRQLPGSSGKRWHHGRHQGARNGTA